MPQFFGKRTTVFCLGLLLCNISLGAAAAENSSTEISTAEHRRWQGAMGTSGLRRSIALGTSLGEWLNRTLSYRSAEQSESIRQRREAAGAPVAGPIRNSSSESKVIQAESLAPISRFANREVLLRSTVRFARRDEPDRLDGRSDRIDFGLFLGARANSNKAGFTGLGLILEDTKGKPQFIEGERAGNGIGLRFDHGEVINKTFAYHIRAEHLWWNGDSKINRPSPTGSTLVTHDVDIGRSLISADLIGNYNVLGGQLRWRSAIHLMLSRYDDQINNLGEAVNEPFGDRERLGVIRTGAYQAWTVGADRQYSPYIELIADHEFTNNLDTQIRDKNTLTFKTGISWLLWTSQRIQIEYQRFQGIRGHRERDSVSLVAILDL